MNPLGESLCPKALETQGSLQAVIFDVDGTLADTERDGHRRAFNEAFARHGLDITWDVQEYGPLLAITGGARRIAGDLRARGWGDGADELAGRVHRTKTQIFCDMVSAGILEPRPGVPDLVADLVDAGIRIAVATTGRRAWVEPLVARLLGDDVVEAMVTGDDVSRLKPDPQVYRRALAQLELPARSAMAVEDSEVGLRAAVGAGLATMVVTNGYTVGQDFTGAALVRPGFDGADPVRAQTCREMHRRWWFQRGPADGV